jgi:hypothetical protein
MLQVIYFLDASSGMTGLHEIAVEAFEKREGSERKELLPALSTSIRAF